MDVQEHKPMNTRDLYEKVSRYIDDNKHSRDVQVRWLSASMEPLLVRISAIMNSRPTIEDIGLIANFKAAEIEKQVASKRDELARLERDLAAAQGEIKRPRAAAVSKGDA